MIKLCKQSRTRLMIMLLLLIIMVTGCKSSEELEPNKIESSEGNEIEQPDVNDNLEHPIVQIEMQDGGTMVFELYPEYAPETVENFVNLVESGFYDGLKFHRIIKGFMAQSGDPLGNGTGGSEKNIKGEFEENGFSLNTLKHVKGVISMARSKNPDSASSQFFIMDGKASSLDGSYAAFGMLIEGEETLATIVDTQVKRNPSGELSVPKVDVVIEKVTVLDLE